ncbi:MAG: DUF2070 family protein, partial [Desulfurococcaceae archaeon]
MVLVRNSNEIYKPKTVISRYYTILFTLPRWQYLAATFIALGAVLVASMREGSYPLLISSFATYAILEVYARLCRRTVFYKVKRRIGLALAVLVYSAVFAAITRHSMVSVISSTAVVAVIVFGLDGTSASRIPLIVAPQMVTLVAMRFLGYYGGNEILTGLLVALILVLINLSMYMFMSRRRVNGCALSELGMLFLRNWLDKKTEIELAFEELGEYQYVNPRIIEFGDLAVVYTDVHYGPFSNIGSSRLPELLSKTFKRLGFRDVIALHGLGSHDRNIVSSKQVSEYIEYLTKTYLGDEKTQLLYHGAFSIRDDEWLVLGIVFDKLSILVVSRPYKGIDDLPYAVQVDYEIKAKSVGLGDVVIIDAHNWELQEEPSLEKLDIVLEKSLAEIARLKSKKPVEVYYKYKCFEAPAPGVVNGDACILCITGENREEACLIYLRGNNVKPNVRDVLLREASALETELIEVLTNDEHSETGTRAYIAYIPVHESPELVEAVRRASEALRKAPYRKSAWLYTCRLNLKLMGRSVHEIKKRLGISVREAAILLLAYVFLTPVVLMLVLRL